MHVLGSGPPLLCVPGGPGRASEYLEDLGGLSRSFTLLRLDQRGTGRSELPEDRESLSFPRLADDLSDVRRAFGLQRVSVLGHSAGCHVALVDAMRRPEQVERLVLVTPSARGLADTSGDVARIRASRAGEPWYPEVAEILEQVALLPEHRRQRLDRGLRPLFYGRWDERAKAHAAATDAQMSLRAAAAFVPAETADVPGPDALSRVRVPTLVVVGELDALTGTLAGEVVAAGLPDARVVSLDGSGHYPWIDEPAAFRDLLAGFLGGDRG